MEIAPGIDSGVWGELRLGPQDRRDWRRARAILRARINDRYILPADRLINAERRRSPARRRFGFAVLALDCLLVETLGAFVKGLVDTTGQSRHVFCEFLRTTPPFAESFAVRDFAEQFYDEFRCGVLHQAEVKGTSLVWSVGPLLRVDDAKMTVNRNRFHGALKTAFEIYLNSLGDPANAGLRDNFTTKMDHIARMPGRHPVPPDGGRGAR